MKIPHLSPASTVEAGLARVPLFAHMGARHLSRLAHLATPRSYRAGTVLTRQGDTNMNFYVILFGTVRIERESEAGTAMPVAEMGPGGSLAGQQTLDGRLQRLEPAGDLRAHPRDGLVQCLLGM